MSAGQEPEPQVTATTTVHFVLEPGARPQVEAYITEAGRAFLEIMPDDFRYTQVLVSGSRADIERVVEDQVRALAALPELSVPSVRTPSFAQFIATLEAQRAEAEAKRFAAEQANGEEVVGDQEQ